ncbi:MAG TPA: response regulator transcription factor [Chloroflexota bacterium]|nr:response regulator transcription factor [Chloroflexota bacterium]
MLIIGTSEHAGEIAGALSLAGYRIWSTERADDARDMVNRVRPDLVVLDLQLSDADGLLFCADLRAQWPDLPIITFRETRRRCDPTLALRLGADDFLAYPVDIHELEARIHAVLRRSMRRRVAPAPEADQIRVGQLTIDRTARRVTLAGHPVRLTPTEYRLLCVLACKPDEVVSRPELAMKVWGYANIGGGRAIDGQIHRLRTKLESAADVAPAIVSQRGAGYRLVAPAESSLNRAYVERSVAN